MIRNMEDLIWQFQGNWKPGAKYVDPAAVGKWAVLVMSENQVDKRPIELVPFSHFISDWEFCSEFVKSIIMKGKSCGMQIANRDSVVYEQIDDTTMDNYFKSAKASKIQFILYIECLSRNAMSRHGLFV